jgi:hypothetical protein
MSAADLGTEADDVTRILEALRALARDAPSPVVRLCLEEARKDIAHLTGVADEYRHGAGAEAA